MESRFLPSKELTKTFSSEVADLIKASFKEKQSCTIALSGGESPKEYLPLLAQKIEITCDAKLHIYQVDERFVAPSSSDLNANMIREFFLPYLIGDNEFIFFNTTLSQEESAKDYSIKLPNEPLDLIILGMGDDGHFASIFPNANLENKDKAEAVIVNNKIKERLTLTWPTILCAKNVVLYVKGENKIGILNDKNGKLPIHELLRKREIFIYRAQ